MFAWKWSYALPGLAIWLALILALLLPKRNRDRRVLLILVPLALVNLLWWGFKEISGMPSNSASQFDTVFHSMTVGIAVLWLVVGSFAGLRGFARFLLCFVTLLIVACLGILSYSTAFSREVALFLVMLAFLSLTVLVATTIAGKLCRGRYRPLCYMLWLGLWIVLGSMLGMSGFYIAGSLIMTGALEANFLQMLLILSVYGGVVGAFLYLLNLPFMILAFVNPLFRERFSTCLRLEPVAATAETD